jgi:hypothetical protein
LRFPFRALPEPGGAALRPRPAIDIVVEGLENARQVCLLDSGATAIRMGAFLADVLAVDLRDVPTQLLGVGGTIVEGRCARVSLEVSDGTDSHSWEAPVWFCDPWIPAFGLLGLTGFFDEFEVTIAAYDEWVELRPIA